MRTLLIMRHAKSSWDNALVGDHDRPLNRRGRRDAPRMGRWLAAHDLAPDAILCSTAARALETAECVADATGADAPVARRALYEGDVEDYVRALRGLPDEVAVALIVGHSPTVALLVDALADEDVVMPTAAVAVLALPIDRWGDLSEEVSGRLRAEWRPREIDD